MKEIVIIFKKSIGLVNNSESGLFMYLQFFREELAVLQRWLQFTMKSVNK